MIPGVLVVVPPHAHAPAAGGTVSLVQAVQLGGDLLVAVAYFSIPAALVRFVRQRRDLPFNWMMLAFAAFIIACGATHALHVLALLGPMPRLSAFVTAVTALVSAITAVLLWRLVPQLVALPTSAELRRANEALAAEVQARERVARDLRATQAGLERRVTERTAALVEANRALRLFASAFEQASDGVIIAAANPASAGPTIVAANSAVAAMTGFAPDEIVGHSVRRLLGPRTDRAEVRRAWRALAQGEPATTEVVNYRRDGSELLVSWRVAPLREAGGAVTHMVAILRDVTDQRRLEQQVRQAQKVETIGQLAGSIAHDFNNILSVIAGNTELLVADLPPGSTEQAVAVEVHDASLRGARLTRQLLAFSRREVRKPTAVDVGALVREVEPLLRRLAGDRITVQVAAGLDGARVWGESDQLEQVLLNLAVNGRDAMPDGGVLTVDVERCVLDDPAAGWLLPAAPAPSVLLRVRDTGRGIPADVLPRIFDPFFSTKPAGQGTGLGLATVHRILLQHGGTLRVVTAPGAGTTIEVALPELSVPAGDAAVARAAPGPITAGRGHVLVVDDDVAVRGLTARIVERAGYTVLAAEGPAHALACARDASQPIDIVLTDVLMPNLTGPALVAAIRTVRPGIPVVYMTGHADGHLTDGDLARDGAMLVLKPFTAVTLTQALARARDGHQVA